MSFELPALPYARDALEPHLGAESFDYHWGKHHRAYVAKLNALTDGTPQAGQTLEQIIQASKGGLFNNAAQAWNHTCFWQSMKPGGGGSPTGDLADAVNRDFGNVQGFKDQFAEAAAGHFGSGWTWLIRDASGLKIVTTANADNPVRQHKTVLVGLDVWEHTYYLDYRNDRPKFIAAFLDHLINWDFAAKNLKG